MAQLDCGQCGYLCESYAAAIAGGTEASLSRCVPGGKATSRALKELLAEIASPDAPKALAVVASAPPLAPQPGDSLAIVARNCPDLVAAIIERLGATFDTPVQSADDIERPLVTALSASCEIRRRSDQAIEVLASRANSRDESRVLQAIAEGYPGAGPQNADLLDLLDAYTGLN